MRTSILLRLVTLPCFFALSLLPLRAADKPEKPLTEEEKKKEEEEKKKRIPALKYDAWCAFSALSRREPHAEDPESTHSRINSIDLEGYGRRGKWAHVVLDLTNTTELKKKIFHEGTASIVFNQVQASGVAGEIPYAITYRQYFKVGPESESQYHFSILCPDYPWSSSTEVRIDAGGSRGYMSRLFRITDLDQNREELIVVVSDKPGSFQNLNPLSKRQGLSPADMTADDFTTVKAGRVVASVVASELPERWQDLSIASLIIIDGPPAEGINDAQWAALKTYAQSGGRILIMAGKDPAKLKGPIEALAGITVRGPGELPGIDQFDPPYFGPKKEKPEDPDWKLPVVEVATPNAGVVKRNSKTQIVEYSARSYGAGLVAFIPYSLTDKVLEFWHGRTTIPLGLLGKEKNLFAIDVDEEEEAAAQNTQNNWRYNGFYGNSVRPIDNKTLASFRTRLDGSFANDTPVVMQAPSTVLQFLLIYLLCAVPLNFIVFTVFKRREAAWLATPAIAVIFTIMAYYTGYRGQTGVNTVNEVTVLEAGPGQTEAVGRTFMGIYAPRRDSYHITFPPRKIQGELFDYKAAPGHLVNQEFFEQRNVELPRMDVLDTGQRLDIESILIQQRSTRRFEIQHRAPVGGGVEMKTSSSNNSSWTELTVVNNTGVNLIQPIFYKNGQFAKLKPNQFPAQFTPGETFDSTQTPLQWQSGRTQAFEELARVHAMAGKHSAERARALTDYLEQHSRQYAAGALFAWMKDPVLPVEIGPVGSHTLNVPTIEGITLLVVPVAMSNKGSRFGPAAFVPPSVSYSQFYNPANPASGEWKNLKGKIPFEGFDQGNNNQPCVHLKFEFGDDFSRKQFTEKRTQLTLVLSGGKGNLAVEAVVNGAPSVEVQRDGFGNFINPVTAMSSSKNVKSGLMTYTLQCIDLFKNGIELPNDPKKFHVVKVVLNKRSAQANASNIMLDEVKINLVDTKN